MFLKLKDIFGVILFIKVKKNLFRKCRGMEFYNCVCKD